MEKKNEQNIVNENELDQVAGGNESIKETVDIVTNSGIFETVADKASDVIDLLKYVWEKGR